MKKHESRRKESKTSTNLEPLLQHNQGQQTGTCSLRSLRCSKRQPGAERVDRRSEVINEALAEEIQREETKKERSSRVTTAAPALK